MSERVLNFMSDFWFNHLKATLTDKGVVAYMWDVSADRFEWAGDLYEFFGLEKQDYPVSNTHFNKMLNPQDVPERLSALHDVLNRDPEHDVSSSFSASYKIRQANGAYIEVEETATLQTGDNSDKRLLCGFLKIRKPKKAEASGSIVKSNISSVAASGHVSSGRMLLQRKVEEWFDTRELGQKSHGYLLAVGIDRMALFNEVMGPRYADEIIEKTGGRLRQIVGDSGSVMRVDGDVYGIFFHRAPHNEMAAVAKYILNNFYNVPIQTDTGPAGVGVSIGGVTVDNAKDPASVITMAEMAMHRAKDKGRSCFVSYDEASHNAADGRSLLKTADSFLKAMKDDRLRFAFQPVMGSRENKISFHECLMRLIDEDGKLVPAGAFIPAIEEMGLSRLVDQHALRMAISELSMFPDLQLSVNVSNLSLNTQDWLRNLVATLRDRPSVARRLIVEITESTVIEESSNIKRIVRTLQDLGCRVALDDFGAGYTAFSQLKDLKIDIIKIDKSFIRNIDEEHNHLFIRTLRTLAEGVNIETVGEGAETMAEAKLLASEGVDHIQGYIFGFPRVERMWLPKDHVHRRVSTEAGQKEGGRDLFYEERIEDIAAWKKSGGV